MDEAHHWTKQYKNRCIPKQPGSHTIWSKSLIPSKECMVISMDDASKESLAKCLKFLRNKLFYLPSYRFSLSFYCMKELEDLWRSYYLSAVEPNLIEQCISDAFAFTREAGIWLTSVYCWHPLQY